MSNERIEALFYEGKDFDQIAEITGFSRHYVKMQTQSIVIVEKMETKGNRLKQIQMIEKKLFDEMGQLSTTQFEILKQSYSKFIV